jgi:hypothetical protein
MNKKLIARELLAARDMVAGGDIDIAAGVAHAYMNMGRDAYKKVKRHRGVEKQSALKERNRNNNTFSFEWSYEGYTRSDFAATAEVTIVLYLDGTAYIWVYGDRPDWGKVKTKIFDKKFDGVIPLSLIDDAIDRVFG